MSVKEKLQKFNDLCRDWNYRNIEMTDAHISNIEIKKDTISVFCELVSPEIDDYVWCFGGDFKNKLLVKKFKKLNLEKKENVLDFISKINDLIDWDFVHNVLDSKVQDELENEKKNRFEVIFENEKILFYSKDLALDYYAALTALYEDDDRKKYNKLYDDIKHSDVKYSDGSKVKSERIFNENDYNDIEAFVPCKKLGLGWFWHKYNDGSGSLVSPEGKEYMSYDLFTNEYMKTEGSKYEFFPLSYYYADGIEPSKFNPFDYMEREMLEFILPREQNREKEFLDSIIKILGIWRTDYDDIRCNAILMDNDKEVANVIACYDFGNKDSEIEEDYLKREFQNLIHCDFEYYFKLPKISHCSKLLQEIYDNVRKSEAPIYHISDKDWNDYYNDIYTDNELEILKEEIKKYELSDVIVFDDNNYKLIAYSELELRFNDDRSLELNVEQGFGMK